MEVWMIIILLIGYGLFEFINAIFFNWRLFLLSEKKYIYAGIFSAISTMMLVSSVIVAAWFGIGQEGQETIWWIVPFVAISMGFGNFIAALIVPKIRERLSKRKSKEEVLNSEESEKKE